MQRQWDGRNVRLEGRNLCVTGVELDRISELKDDGEALAKYLGPDTCAAIQHEVGPGLARILDTLAPWRR